MMKRSRHTPFKISKQNSEVFSVSLKKVNVISGILDCGESIAPLQREEPWEEQH
jgi:hypothetical protein